MRNEVNLGRLCLVLSWLVLSALPGSVSAGLESGIQVNAGGQLRSYDLYVPDGLGNEPRPLVIDMHGWSLFANDQRRRSGFRNLADTEKFIVAWPQSFGDYWNGFFGAAGTDDVGFIRAVVAHIDNRRNIDPKRIYATGWSNGGEMAYRLACDASDLFAAVATVAGTVLVGSELNCVPARPVPVLSFRGRDDGIVPYGGGFITGFPENVLGARDTHNLWKDINGCRGADRNQALGSASCTSNPQCEGGVSVTSCEVEGGGRPSNHDLYAAPGVDIASEAWKFFQAFTLPELQDKFQVNSGLNDAWYNPATDGQGFFVVVFEEIQSVFLAWFTYDTEMPNGEPAKFGHAGHRWLTAFGPYSGASASLEVLSTSNGIFDTATQVEREVVGSIDLTFNDCLSGQIDYDLGSIGRQGQIPIQRIVTDLVPACDGSAEPGGSLGGGFQVNRGLNDAWFQPATDGQGFFIIAWPEIEQIFLSWFTYETELPLENTAQLGNSGQRWLTALGPYSGNTAVLDVSVTSGGLFDDPRDVDNTPGGTITLEFEDCSAGVVSYDIDSIDQRGEIPIQRIAPDNLPTCEVLTGTTSGR